LTSGLPTYAVAVPAYRDRLSDDELVSLRHLDRFLPEADKYLVMPETLDFHRHDYREMRFAPAFFKGIPGYNSLMLSRDFYARFAAYEYVLIHQLDALILHGRVESFLALDVDYLGAPWVEHDADGAPLLTRVGNGGLSLRRVDGFRKLLESPPHRETARDYYRRRYNDGSHKYRLLGVPRAGLAATGLPILTHKAIARCLGRPFRADFAADARAYSQDGAAEDRFISLEASNYCPSFKFATIHDALRFAFEQEPRFCLEQTGGKMPFGTHAWGRYDREFWEPHLLA
jgi:hypothetical protein